MSSRDAAGDKLPVATDKESVSKTVVTTGEGTATHTAAITSSASEPRKPSRSVESLPTASHEALWNTPHQGSMGSLSVWNTPQQGSMGFLNMWNTPQQGPMSYWTLPQLPPLSHCNLTQQSFMAQWNPPQEASTSQWNQASIGQWIPPYQTSYMNQWDPVQQNSGSLWSPNLSATVKPMLGLWNPSLTLQPSLPSSNELFPPLEETSNSFSKLSIGPSSTASTSTVASLPLPLPSSASSGLRSPPKPAEEQCKSASYLRDRLPLKRGSKTSYRGRQTTWHNKSNIYCPFCRQNGEEDYFHAMRNDLNEVVCPVLRAYRCRLCGATGPKAHTLKYCPLNPYTRGDPVASGFRPGLTPPHLDPFQQR